MSEHSRSIRKKFKTGAGVGFSSRDRSVVNLDRRTRPGRVLWQVEADLVQHCSGAPRAPEMLLISFAAIKSTRLMLITDKLLFGDDLANSAEDHEHSTSLHHFDGTRG